MNRKQKNRLLAIILIILLLGAAAGLILYALKQNINLFYTPTQLLTSSTLSDHTMRIGGYVKKHSVHYNNSGDRVEFIITDYTNQIKVSYQGVLPNLFREGQGVVVTGKWDHQTLFFADEVLAKHDEKYMPPSIAKELKKEENHAS